MTFRILTATAVAVSMLTVAPAATRKWTDATGTYAIEAELVDVKDGKVRLKRADGQIIAVPLEKLSKADREFATSQQPQGAENGEQPAAKRTLSKGQLAGKNHELVQDENQPAGKRSIAGGGHAVRFTAPDDSWYVTSVRLYGSRYGTAAPPKEDFHVWLCDKDFKVLVDLPFRYAMFQRGDPKWVAMNTRPTKIPKEFVVCVGFNPAQTKGVYVHHSGKSKGTSLVGLPGGEFRPFEEGEWMIRVTLDQAKGAVGAEVSAKKQ